MSVRTPDLTAIIGVTRLAVAAAGLALLSYGAWLAYQPAGFIVGGGLLFLTALIGGLRAR